MLTVSLPVQGRVVTRLGFLSFATTVRSYRFIVCLEVITLPSRGTMALFTADAPSFRVLYSLTSCNSIALFSPYSYLKALCQFIEVLSVTLVDCDDEVDAIVEVGGDSSTNEVVP